MSVKRLIRTGCPINLLLFFSSRPPPQCPELRAWNTWPTLLLYKSLCPLFFPLLLLTYSWLHSRFSKPSVLLLLLLNKSCIISSCHRWLLLLCKKEGVGRVGGAFKIRRKERKEKEKDLLCCSSTGGKKEINDASFLILCQSASKDLFLFFLPFSQHQKLPSSPTVIFGVLFFFSLFSPFLVVATTQMIMLLRLLL